jgi:hypothetical protein
MIRLRKNESGLRKKEKAICIKSSTTPFLAQWKEKLQKRANLLLQVRM